VPVVSQGVVVQLHGLHSAGQEFHPSFIGTHAAQQQPGLARMLVVTMAECAVSAGAALATCVQGHGVNGRRSSQ